MKCNWTAFSIRLYRKLLRVSLSECYVMVPAISVSLYLSTRILQQWLRITLLQKWPWISEMISVPLLDFINLFLPYWRQRLHVYFTSTVRCQLEALAASYQLDNGIGNLLVLGSLYVELWCAHCLWILSVLSIYDHFHIPYDTLQQWFSNWVRRRRLRSSAKYWWKLGYFVYF